MALFMGRYIATHLALDNEPVTETLICSCTLHCWKKFPVTDDSFAVLAAISKIRTNFATGSTSYRRCLVLPDLGCNDGHNRSTNQGAIVIVRPESSLFLTMTLKMPLYYYWSSLQQYGSQFLWHYNEMTLLVTQGNTISMLSTNPSSQTNDASDDPCRHANEQ